MHLSKLLFIATIILFSIIFVPHAIAGVFQLFEQNTPYSVSESGTEIEVITKDYPEYCDRKDTCVNPSPEALLQAMKALEDKYQIPSLVIEALADDESKWKQFDENADGKIKISFDCGIGLMQVTTGTIEEFGFNVELLISDPFYNLEAGVQVLNKKWNGTPVIGNNERYMLENWYYAIWGYNGGCFYNYPKET